jgi:NAD(P)-dependent dehydrogenase (short-subunit alcohol dehydrogenase family)
MHCDINEEKVSGYLMTLYKMKDQVVVIIGGSSGIGLATACMAAKEGAHLIIAGRSQDKLINARAKIGEKHCETYFLDNRTPEAVEEFFSKIRHLHHLFAPGASYVRGPITSDLKIAESCFHGKFWPQYWAVKYGLSKIYSHGSIVLMSGAYSQRPPTDGASYAACNAGLECLAKALAVELAPIRVNAVAPGAVRTDFVWEGGDKESRERVYKEYASQCLLKRVAHPDEIAMAILYLMCSTYTTSSTLYPDGGFTLR